MIGIILVFNLCNRPYFCVHKKILKLYKRFRYNDYTRRATIK